MNITLKAKHLYFIADIIGNWPTDDNSNIWQQIINVTAGKDDNDYCTVNAPVFKIVQVYSRMAELPEGQMKTLNTEINGILMPQLTEQVQLGNEEAIQLVPQLQQIIAANSQVTANKIAQMKLKLHGNAQ